MKLHLKAPSERRLLEHVKELADLVRNSVLCLRDLYLALEDGAWDKALEKALETAGYEHKADKVKENIALEIFSGAFIPDFREAVMVLIENVDGVADLAKDTARIATQRRFDVNILSYLKPGINLYVNLVVKAVDLMYKSICELSLNIEKALKTTRMIEEAEVSVDEVKMNLISKLYELENRVSVLTLLQIKDMILFLDNVVDKAEDVSDTVELIYLSLKP